MSPKCCNLMAHSYLIILFSETCPARISTVRGTGILVVIFFFHNDPDTQADQHQGPHMFDIGEKVYIKESFERKNGTENDQDQSSCNIPVSCLIAHFVICV